MPPETITRDARGRATVRAIKLTEPLQARRQARRRGLPTHQAVRRLLQVAPKYGAESTEQTDVWIMYDENNIYVSARCWDSAPPEQWIANELRRDTNQLRQNDHFGVMFDTFYDRRSGFLFYTNPLGALADYSVVDEGGSNTDWNPVWELAHRHASTAAGRSRWRFRSSRCATAPAPTRCGASSCAARSATRTSGRT